jgi:hypothetical protein
MLMSASAAFMGVLGIAASFFSHELLRYAGATVETPAVLLVQVCGALYLGFAFLNWYLRGFVIGGIYNRPLAVANLVHFAVVAITLLKAAPALDSPLVWVITAAYVVFAAWFGLVMFSAAPLGKNPPGN